MFRRRVEQAPLEESFSGKSKVEEKIGKIHTKRGDKTKEGLKKIEEEKKIKNYQVTLYFIGAGAPLGPGTRSVELSEYSREIIAEGVKQTVEADGYKLTSTGVEIYFNGREFNKEKEAVLFGKKKMAEIEGDDHYKYTIKFDDIKGEGGVEVKVYNELSTPVDN